ncbi:WecB/TagA/CpsF family glycosyltransferase [Arthrobacter cavernae]|uniref:WecB/TagA/CpsF family glycosyltransferase n=1 Tax=Arthrobacter cavernae TaxID=2817681 RepID=A0A939KJG9_9MICC|nr:WecB/TagA/CpsF family glycosyltransferase [Arthrobacter cavernae]MBO1267719.1 WecB/TagA/CpsF family glycosyltransferase [Arthrobacter cavernae]
MTKTLFSADPRGKLLLNEMPIYSGSHSELLQELSRLSEQAIPLLVVTPNVDQVLTLDQSSELLTAFKLASLRTIDGMPLRLLAKLVGVKNPHRNTGADLLPSVCSSDLFRGKTIAITGGRDDVLECAVNQLSVDNPEANIVGIPFPHIKSIQDEASWSTIRALKECSPAVVFVCLGAPKQEAWFAEWRQHLPAGVYIGAGAAVDFAAGAVSRAPRWMQRAGLEWVHRLVKDPRRLAHRYLVKGPRFLPIMIRSIIHASK